MKINDYEFRGTTPELADFKDDLLTILNFGKLGFQVVSEPPVYTAENGEAAFYQNGNDKRWYFYTGGVWRSFAFNNQVVNAWVTFSGTGAVTIKESYNIRSITDNGTGDYTLNFSSNFSNSTYAVVGFTTDLPGGESGSVVISGVANNPSPTSCRINVKGFSGGANTDAALVNAILVGNV